MTEALLRPARPGGALPETPYVGLVPYGEDDAAFFFGREAEKTIVTANLRAARLTLVYGPSGVGKTSLLQAGVVHDLRGLAERNAATGNGRAPFAIAVVRSWRDDPLAGLMEQTRRSVHEAAGGAAPEQWRPGEPVVETLRAWTERARRLLVVLDQFEDYFLYHPGETGEATFDTEFPLIVNEPNLRVHFLVSIREDAWAKLDRFEGRIPQLFANYVRVEHLTREGGRDAIEGPVAEYNRRRPADGGAYTVEPELATAVLDAASSGPEEGTNGSRPTSDEVETPFLQLVMERLWRATGEAGERALTLATLERLGGAQRIVEQHLVEALGSLAPQEQAIAAEAFRYLVTRSRRRVVQSLSDLAEWLGRPEAELAPVLEKLASGEGGRILRPVPPPPGQESEGARYELFHDVLAEPILEWRRQFGAAREREAEALQQRTVRRRLVGIAVGLLVLVLAFAAFAGWALHERSIAARRADVAQSQALAARSLRVQNLAPRQALALAAEAERKSATAQAEEALRRTLVGWPRPTVLVPPGQTTYGVAFSRNGRFVATAGRGGASVSSTSTGKVVATLVPRGLVYSAAFSPDSREVVTSSADGAVRLWRVQGWSELPSRARILPRLLARAAVTADGRFLVAGGHPGWPNRIWRFRDGRIGARVTRALAGWIDPDGTARVVAARTGSAAARLARPVKLEAASSPSGRLLAAPGHRTPVYRIAGGMSVATLSTAHGAVFAPGGRRVAAEGPDTVVWDAVQGRPQAILTGRVTGGAFSRNGTLFAAASSTQPVAHVWNSRTGELLAELPPRPPRTRHQVVVPDPYPVRAYGSASGEESVSGAVTRGPGPAFTLVPAASFSADGDLVATWGRQRGGAQLWQPFGTHELAVLRGASTAQVAGEALLLPAAASPDGRLVATARGDGRVNVWRTRDGRRQSTLRGGSEYVSSLAFDPTARLVAASRFDHTVRLWRVADGTLVDTLRGHTKRVGGVAFSPDGTLLASAGEDGTVRIWRVPDGAAVHVLRAGGPVASVAFSPDGRSLVAAGDGGTTRIWSTGNWRPRAVLRAGGSNALVVHAAFSSDGRYVATLDLGATARLWHSSGGLPIRTFHNVSSVAFAPGGGELVTGGGDGTARLFLTRSGVATGVLRGHTNTVAEARFSSDGGLIVTAGLDGTARVWQAATEGSVAVVTPGRAAVDDAVLSAHGRLVTIGEDGVRLYTCEPCLPPAQLLTLAERRLAPPPTSG